MKIILLGKMGAGKDTVADYLHREYAFSRWSFATKIKGIARDLFPGQFVGGNKPRELLQKLGARMRELDEDCWANYVLSRVSASNHLYLNHVITDCRYSNELRLAQAAGFIPVRVVCREEVRLQRLEARDKVIVRETFRHPSETELDGTNIENVLDNSGGMGELFEQIDGLIG